MALRGPSGSWGRFLRRAVGRTLPGDRAPVEELCSAFRALPPAVSLSPSDAERRWVDNRRRLRQLVLEADPREFLRWDVIKATMVAGNTDYVTHELAHLKGHREWERRWRPAIREAAVGRPRRLRGHRQTSGTLVHHAYHACRFEDATGLSLDQARFVVEFGGGYGSLCRLVHNLGFEGTYVIFDLPEFSALQRFFLRSLGIPVADARSDLPPAGGVLTISDVGALAALLSDRGAGDAIFIATWSLSEAPLPLRALVLREVASFDGFLIAYQDRFGEADNVRFFAEWRSGMREIDWHESRIEHLGKNSRYLFGVNRSRGRAPRLRA